MHPHRLVRCRWPVLSALAVAALCSPAAHAQAPAPADAARIASQGADGVAACVTCHGAKGEGNPAAGFPHLAGLGSGYLYEQLTALANGSRANPVMAPVAKGLSDAQRQALAEYYAGLSAPFDADRLAATHLGEPAKADTGAWLAVRGAWDRNVPACNQCHGPGGIGVGTAFPVKHALIHRLALASLLAAALPAAPALAA
ncbi:c-type cytochrome, partial [Bordetella pertussis]|uniref:c-type cytochrome n=1 Tax=Bordetella pertussis TaxID=520 RepID=UPI00067FB051